MPGADRQSEFWPARPWQYLLPVAIAIGLGLVVGDFVELVRVWGDRAQELQVEVGYALALVWALVLGASIVVWPVRAEDKPRLLLLWGIKILMTLGFMLLYEHLYGLDSFWYSKSARLEEMPTSAVDPHFRGGTGAIILFSWWLNKLGPDSFHALKVSHSLIGLIAVYIFYRAAGLARPVPPKLLYLLALFPSVLFWSSTLGKDTVVLLGGAIATLGSMGIIRRRGTRYWFIFGAGVLLASWIRMWMGVILLAPVGFVIFFGQWSWNKRIVALVAVGLFAVAARDQIGARLPTVAGAGVVAAVREIAQDGASWKGGSARRPPEISSVAGLAAYVPVATFTALFRPLPGEVKNPFGLLSGLEAVVLLVLLAVAVKRSRWSDLRDPAVQWAIVLLLVWGAIHGLTVYNYGALVRFKLQILPITLCLLLHLSARRPVPAQEARASA